MIKFSYHNYIPVFNLISTSRGPVVPVHDFFKFEVGTFFPEVEVIKQLRSVLQRKHNGGSSILSCFILLGILEGIAIKNADADATEFEAYVNQYDEEEDWEDEDAAYDDDYEEEEEEPYDEDAYEYDSRYGKEDDE